ncbi:hypothetical protein MTO96_031407 [Rhipicephalus appendiculatus]
MILVAAFLLLQSGLEPATALNNHESTPGQFLTEQASMPYQFSYFAGGHDGSHSRHETRDANGRVSGHYTLATDEGSQRVVCYVADEHGFRAWVDTNEQGTDNQDPADVSVRSTAPGTAGVPRGPIKGVCGGPPPPAGPPAQTQILVTSPPVVIPPPVRKPAYVPPPAVHHEEVIVPPPVVKVYPPPVQQVVVTPPDPAKTYYVPPHRSRPRPTTFHHRLHQKPTTFHPSTWLRSLPVVVPPPTRRLSYQPAREEVLPPIAANLLRHSADATPARAGGVRAFETRVPRFFVLGILRTKATRSGGGPYIAPRYEPWTQSSYKTYRAYNEPSEPWRPKGDIPIGVSYKMSISRGPGGPYPWQDEVVSRPGSYYRHAQPSTPPSGQHYYRPAESAPEPAYPSRSQGGYAKNDLQDDDDDTYDFKRPSYG